MFFLTLPITLRAVSAPSSGRESLDHDLMAQEFTSLQSDISEGIVIIDPDLSKKEAVSVMGPWWVASGRLTG